MTRPAEGRRPPAPAAPDAPAPNVLAPDALTPDAPSPGAAGPGAPVSRRRVLQVLGLAAGGAAAGGAAACRPDAPAGGAGAGAGAGAAGAARPAAARPAFFTPQERRTVDVLVDYVIPRDARSGSATDAGVPAWMDAFLADAETEDDTRARMRGGLAWLDAESARRFGAPFAGAADAQRRQLLDDIAYPARAPRGMGHGVAFFNMFRDMTASGFFSSRIGHEDLRYMGNVAVPVWDGCPPEATARLGVSYDLMATRVAPRPGPQRA